MRLSQEAEKFYSLPELISLVSADRLQAVSRDIAAAGCYTPTPDELLAGAKIAWRNHARCSGRYSWRSLQLLDARSCESPEEVAEACWDHLRVSTNNGRLRPVVTVFKPRLEPDNQVRIANAQLIRYAGYKSADGRVTGDPDQVEFTQRVMDMGWRGAGTEFDVLPLVIFVDGKPPVLFEIPPEHVLEVPIIHPRFDWFKDLNLRWHANPAISNMCLEIGGLRYTAAPFSGWYVGSEIGARNLSDVGRYNVLPRIAEKMGLDTRRNASLWRDRALLELNEAVLFSYAEAGVYVVDHHTAAAQFVAHIERETAAGRAVPAEWSWINPAMSPSTTPTFHRTYDPPDFDLRPNFVKQDPPEPWSTDTQGL
ncbi:nitric-oxide synthase [Catenulispora sp. EB89]|uniref:nitric oxide synthase oxygenase n=1 Tax=Catenulispora sp. EB89 TaxID=3156257 RepID=UPI003517810B